MLVSIPHPEGTLVVDTATIQRQDQGGRSAPYCKYTETFTGLDGRLRWTDVEVKVPAIPLLQAVIQERDTLATELDRIRTAYKALTGRLP